VRRHLFTDRPWLAADAVLGPWIETDDLDVVQTGAWMMQDQRPISAELEAFLNDGDPPVYFGFSSMAAPENISRAMIMAARENGRRAIVSRGWAEVVLPNNDPDCLSIGEDNLQALFRRVAAVVHHGGAGTTTIAAMAGVPQVVVPQIWDQHYWAKRVQQLGIGIAHAPGTPTAESLTEALRRTLDPDVAVRARSVAASIRTDGAEVAARLLINRN
jgi:vancomycin aglycone glucosyltransferase